MNKINKKEIIYLYTVKRVSLAKLGKYYHVSRNRIRDYLEDNGVEIHTRGHIREKKPYECKFTKDIDIERVREFLEKKALNKFEKMLYQ